MSRYTNSIWFVAIVALSSLFACRKKANEGPPDQALVRIDEFDGQKFVGRLTLQNARGGEVSADGKLTLTLVAGEELCSVSVDVQKNQFSEDKDNPIYTTMPISISAAAPCQRPAPGGPSMSLRVHFETPGGVKIEKTEKAMAAADWAADLQAKETEAILRSRIPNETQRLASIVDVARTPAKAAQVSCPKDVTKEVVTRIVQDHLLQISGREPGARNDLCCGWASDQPYQWLAGWTTKRMSLDEKMVALALGEPRQYLEIIHVDAFTAPALSREQGTNVRSRISGFKPGSIAATVSIIDVANKTVACRGKVTARSSTEIPPAAGDALALDLRRNFEKSVANLETAIASAPLR